MNRQRILEKIRAVGAEGKGVVALYNEISAIVAEEAYTDAQAARRGSCACYLSVEFLVGRAFYNNLMEAGILEDVQKILAEKGVDIADFEQIGDAALGNGGLGRLAACFLDSAAAEGLPLYGYGIRYKYGLFRQKFEDGYQTEYPDDWQRFGDPWSFRREDEAREIAFADMTVRAVPYDMPVIGKRTNILRLFQAEGSPAAEKISEYLYPADDTEEGKLLRLRQEYFFSAAAVGELVERFIVEHGEKFELFPRYNCIQLNDTHPVLAVAEFVRVLTEEHRVPFPKAVALARQAFNYTNHTILPEALECWPEKYLKKILPHILRVLKRLDSFARREFSSLGCTAEEAAQMAVKSGKTYRMASLAVFIGRRVNGVAKLHSDIIRRDLFPAAAKYYPEKFCNQTNGVTQRRWLELCDAPLASFLDKWARGWRQDFEKISALSQKCADGSAISEFIAAKEAGKRALYAAVKKRDGAELLPNAIVYAQIKRLHEYKRQLMTAFAVLEIYFQLKRGELPDFAPSVFLFGAKSAPSYFRAKGIIKFINDVAAMIAADGEVNQKLQVVFVADYGVSYAEKIVAGSDVSLQVSAAGLEASGTGNMKFMMNGAVTCGTMDGANIEIFERAGRENNYVFGAEADELERLRREGYDPAAYLAQNEDARRALEMLQTFPDERGYYKELYDSLTVGASWHKPDHYFIFRDLGEYVRALLQINRDYQDRRAFAEKQMKNVASSAYFSSDRTVRGYAAEIWGLCDEK